MANKLTKEEIQELAETMGKPIPDEIVAILEKDRLSAKDIQKRCEFFGTVEQLERGKVVSQRHREAAKKYREQHPPLPDPEWW
jgi:hypothetical protein